MRACVRELFGVSLLLIAAVVDLSEGEEEEEG